MPRRIVIVQGHPDPKGGHFGHALADSYTRGALQAGHEVETISVAEIDFPILRSDEEFETGTLTQDIKAAQDKIQWSNHLVIFYPLWLGTMPALLKGFLEQVLRRRYAFLLLENGRWEKRLKGRSARIVVTMRMPALAYRLFFGAHSLRSLERNILGFCGFGPLRTSTIGLVDSPNPKRRERWLERMEEYGKRGS